MNRKIVTLLLAAGALVGVSSVASAQLTGQPWNPMWDMVMIPQSGISRIVQQLLAQVLRLLLGWIALVFVFMKDVQYR